MLQPVRQLVGDDQSGRLRASVVPDQEMEGQRIVASRLLRPKFAEGQTGLGDACGYALPVLELNAGAVLHIAVAGRSEHQVNRAGRTAVERAEVPDQLRLPS